MSRIVTTDTVGDVVVKMCEGNPGAMTVCAELLEEPEGFFCLLDLDTLRCYGPNIWVAYKDICSEDIHKLKADLRSGAMEAALQKNGAYQYYLAEQEGRNN